jgi:UDP-GlcNAc:undecaprenyl-phosphate GlcNAc-1-phosphate transferase
VLTPFLVFVLAFGLTAATVPLCRRLAPVLGVIAHPVDDRWNRRAVPKLGGLAMLAGVAVTLVAAGWTGPTSLVVLMGALMFAVGLADDMRPIAPATKLVLQTLVAALFIYFTPGVSITGIPVLDIVVALLWIVGLTNAFNLLDNIDGLAAGTAAIAAASLIILLQLTGNPALGAVVLTAAALAGAASGFLLYNFQPASIFMGDAGSHLLGSVIAGATLLASADLNGRAIPVGAVPVMLLLIPIVDTTFVTLTRGLAGRSAFLGGRDHLSHRLVALGIPERRAVLVLYALAASGGAVAVGLTQLDASWSVTLALLYVVAIVSFGVYLAHIEVQHPEQPVAPPLASDVAYGSRAYEAVIDLCFIAIAYYFAFSVRFHDADFAHFLPYFIKSLPIVLACQIVGLWSVGKYRSMWYSLNAAEVFTILRGIVVGVSLSIISVLFLYRFEGFSRIVFAFDVLFLACLLAGWRMVVSLADDFLRQSRLRGRQRVLIYGAGASGRLVARELMQNAQHDLAPVGFIDDDPEKRRMRIEGLRVLGSASDLPGLIPTHQITEVIIGVHALSPDRFDDLTQLCGAYGLHLRRMRFALEDVKHHEERGVLRFPADRR